MLSLNDFQMDVWMIVRNEMTKQIVVKDHKTNINSMEYFGFVFFY